MDYYKESSHRLTNAHTRTVRVPYYFNIAPDRDLVIALSHMSSRGIIYEGKYRQLIKLMVKTLTEYEATLKTYEAFTISGRWKLNTFLMTK